MTVKMLSLTDMGLEVHYLQEYIAEYGSAGSLEDILKGFKHECKYARDIQIVQLEVSHIQQLIDMGVLCYADYEEPD